MYNVLKSCRFRGRVASVFRGNSGTLCRALSTSGQTPYIKSLSRRNVIRLVAFGAGVSIYFFLPDPSLVSPTPETAALTPRNFTPAEVISTEPSGAGTKLITLAVPPHVLPRGDVSQFAPIWSVFIKDDDIQVERPYTPLMGVNEMGHMLFWIKKYPQGEVGRWLHSKRVGDTIELRGPLKTWTWKDEEWDEIVMISGGTGITPFYQLFHNLISQPTQSKTRFTLLHSSCTPAELPPPIIMESMTNFAREHPDRFRLQVFVDTDEGSSPPSLSPPLKVGRIGQEALHRALNLIPPRRPWWQKLIFKQPASEPVSARTLFLICGPESMVNAISGPYGRNFSQGAVGGILGNMGCTSDQLWKF